jgi:hypothetical protein
MTMSDPFSDAMSDTEPTQAGEWLDLRAAAMRLGVSDRTLFRRISAGKLVKRERADGRIEVWLPLTDGQTASPDSVGHTEEQQAERVLAVAQRFNDAVSLAVSQQLAVHVEKITELARENGELSAENTRLRERVAELETRQTASATMTDTVSVSDTSGEPPRRPWWQFWGP